jgi:hypothetical protein
MEQPAAPLPVPTAKHLVINKFTDGIAAAIIMPVRHSRIHGTAGFVPA